MLKGRSLACGVMFSLVFFVDDYWVVTALLSIMPNCFILNIDGCPCVFFVFFLCFFCVFFVFFIVFFHLVRDERDVKIFRNSTHAREQTTHCCGLVLRACALHGQRYY